MKWVLFSKLLDGDQLDLMIDSIMKGKRILLPKEMQVETLVQKYSRSTSYEVMNKFYQKRRRLLLHRSAFFEKIIRSVKGRVYISRCALSIIASSYEGI